MKTTKITTLFLGFASAMALAQEGSACIPFVNGTGDYTKNCYNAGLLEMTEGKCYALNPDRYRDVENQLWINNVATQEWWWVETPCIAEVSSSSEEPESSSSEIVEPESSSSEIVEPESSSSHEAPVSSSSAEPIVVSNCIEFVNGSGNYTENCYNAGLLEMEEGKCYAINPDRYNDVKNQLWINNVASQVWWWQEVSCGDVIESSSSEESSSSVESSSSEESSSSVESSSSEESSSSVESSSSEESSSSAESSSSEIVVSTCIEYVNGTGDYDQHCYNAGLRNMAEGKCYTMNPARVAEGVPQWINDDATQAWWWVETSCGEEPVVEEPIEIVCKGDDCADLKPILKEPKPAPSFSVGRDNGTLAIAEAVASKASMAVANNMLSIATTSNGVKSVKVFSVRGDMLLSETFSGAAKTVDMAQFAGKGAVIVRLVEGRKVLATKRIAVR